MNNSNTDYSAYKSLVISHEGRVTTVMLNRADAMNAISDEMHHELSRIFFQLADDKQVGIIVLTGAGKAFCAGGDIPWMEEMAASLPFHLDNLRVAHNIVLGILDCPKPIICRMNGDAIGLGASIALLCDIIIATDTAKIADPHVKIGLVAGDGGALIWPQLIGYAKAKEFLFTGSVVLAPEAARIGLINHAVKAEELDAMVKKMVGKLLSVSLSAVAYTKHAVNAPLRQAVHSVLDMSQAFEGLSMLQNADWKEGIQAFKEKRAPQYNKD